MRRWLVLLLFVHFSASFGWTQSAPPAAAATYSPFSSAEEAAAFLRSARVLQNKQLGGGVSGARKLLLDDGKIQHHAVFKDIDVHRKEVTIVKGVPQTDFKDSWRYEVAAYELDKLLGMNMIPVTVARRIEDKEGSLQLWMDGCITEAQRLKSGKVPPDSDEWNHKMLKCHLFDNLVYNTDSNLGNSLVTPEYQVFKIDHARAFKNLVSLPNTDHLTAFSKSLIEALDRLDKPSLSKCCRSYLSSMEIDSLLKRKALILNLYRRLLAERGDSILYCP